MVMLLAPGELTNRSPFGAYVIIRGDRRSAKLVTVKPFAAFGIMPSGLATERLGFGLAAAGEGSVSARGCGTTVFCCAATSDVANATAVKPANIFAVGCMPHSCGRGDREPGILALARLRLRPTSMWLRLAW
jgi:hypothetical protein